MIPFIDTLDVEQRQYLEASLGNTADAAIARKLGTYSALIRGIRVRRGIQLQDKKHLAGVRLSFEQSLIPARRDYILARLGKMSDAEIARTLNVSPSDIRNMRIRRNIPPFFDGGKSSYSLRFWTPERIEEFLRLYKSGEETQESIMKKMHLGAPFAVHVHNLKFLGIELPKRKFVHVGSVCYQCPHNSWKPGPVPRSHGKHVCTKYGVSNANEKAQACETFRRYRHEHIQANSLIVPKT